MSHFLVDCSAHNKVRPPSTFSPSRRSPPDIASLPPVAVQRFYNRSRKRSFQQITGYKSPSLNIPINTLGDALRDSMGTIRHHSAQEILVRDEMPDDITGEPVDPEEVVARLTKAASSAPSPLDRLTYQHLKRFDAEGKVLAALFTACLRTGLIPSQWRSYVTILLYKRPKEPTDQEAANPKNWRPIALLPTISKVLTGILADRLSLWASRVAAISPSQKGCYKGEGCFEHIHIMNALKSLSSASKPVHVAFLDLADAFTSVPHDLIFDTLRARSVSNACIDILRSLYTNTSTIVANAPGDTTSVDINSGVRQGCPASPILFALAIEPLLRTPFDQGSGFSLGGEEVHILAYADDLVVVASSPAALQAKLSQLSTRAAHLGLSFNPAKCATLSWGRSSPAQPITIDGIPLKSIEQEDFYKYLGTPIGMSSWQPDHSTVLSTFKSELETVCASPLRPWQKIDALKTFVFTKLGYHLRASSMPTQYLERRKGGIDRWAARAVKRVLHLPTSASQAYLHTPQHLGGVGLPCARTELAVLQVANFFRMATCPDPVVRNSSLELLRRLVTQRCLVETPTLDQCAAFLNGELSLLQRSRNTLLSPVLASVAYLRKEIGLRVAVSGEDLALSFCLRDGPEWLVTAEVRAQAISWLHQAVGLAFFAAWKAQPNQGKAAPLIASEPSALAPFNRFSSMRFCDWRFLHRARLNLIPTNAVKAAYFPEVSARCRVCGYEQETLPHILCSCWRHSALLNHHHNIIQEAVSALSPFRAGRYL